VTNDAALHTREMEEAVRRLFQPVDPAGRRLGVEVEVLPVDAHTRRVAPIPRSLEFLRDLAVEEGWREEPSEHGAPWFRAAGGVISFEPGGQIEYSSPPEERGSPLLRRVAGVMDPVRASAAGAGIDLLEVGLDPHNRPEAAPLQLTGARYRRMARHLAAIGPWGARMMRQSVALHVNVDFGPDPARSWRVINAAVPVLVAMFANSPRLDGADSGWRSNRARAWRELDPARTGFFPGMGDGPRRYLDFALGAADLFSEGVPRPFAVEHPGGVRAGIWSRHLSTLFPEVRPKGYLEVRCFDALPSPWLAAPLVAVTALAFDDRTAEGAESLLGTPDSATLRAAGEHGLADERLADAAQRLVPLVLEGAERLDGYWERGDLERAAAFFERYTLRGRSPADDSSPAATPALG
jgi:glutamate--cysteine ligase